MESASAPAVQALLSVQGPGDLHRRLWRPADQVQAHVRALSSTPCSSLMILPPQGRWIQLAIPGPMPSSGLLQAHCLSCQPPPNWPLPPLIHFRCGCHLNVAVWLCHRLAQKSRVAPYGSLNEAQIFSSGIQSPQLAASNLLLQSYLCLPIHAHYVSEKWVHFLLPNYPTRLTTVRCLLTLCDAHHAMATPCPLVHISPVLKALLSALAPRLFPRSCSSPSKNHLSLLWVPEHFT